MPNDAAHRDWWRIFEVAVGLPYLVGIGLQLAVPLRFPPGFAVPVMLMVGAALVVVGLAFIVLARRELALHRQPTDPGLATSRLVTTGVFSVSRNPLYLGGSCLLAGIALALRLPWALVSLIPGVLACRYLLIAPEESYLAAKFGTDYAQYAASVRRWLGRVRG